VLTVERRLGGARGGSCCRESMTADSDHAERKATDSDHTERKAADSDHAERRAPAQKAARVDRRAQAWRRAWRLLLPREHDGGQRPCREEGACPEGGEC
jgi:hypothetical protein